MNVELGRSKEIKEVLAERPKDTVEREHDYEQRITDAEQAAGALKEMLNGEMGEALDPLDKESMLAEVANHETSIAALSVLVVANELSGTSVIGKANEIRRKGLLKEIPYSDLKKMYDDNLRLHEELGERFGPRQREMSTEGVNLLFDTLATSEEKYRAEQGGSLGVQDSSFSGNEMPVRQVSANKTNLLRGIDINGRLRELPAAQQAEIVKKLAAIDREKLNLLNESQKYATQAWAASEEMSATPKDRWKLEWAHSGEGRKEAYPSFRLDYGIDWQDLAGIEVAE